MELTFPPRMKMRVAFSAATLEPVIGASTQSAPRTRTRSANLAVAAGEIVLESATTAPSVSELKAPRRPNMTCSTAAVSETQSQTTSAPLAASSGVDAACAPSTGLVGERFQTVTSYPAFTKPVAIERPIIPNPRKATFIFSPLDLSRLEMRHSPLSTRKRSGKLRTLSLFLKLRTTAHGRAALQRRVTSQ